MVIENCQRMGHFCCLQLHFFQLWKAKLRKYRKVEEKWLFIPFPLILCYNLAKNQLPNTFFEKNMKIFHFLTPQMPKNCNFQRKKRPFKFNSGFNNQQNLLIFGLVTAFRNTKVLWKPHFLIFDFFKDLSKNSDKMTKISKIFDIIVHIFKKDQKFKKTVPLVCKSHIEVPLGQILAF